MALDFFAGCVGGAAGILVGHPLDTVKVRIQTQCPVNPKYRGTFHCLSSIARQESIAGLYKGIASPLYGVTAVNAMVFGVYGLLKPLVVESPGNDALWAHFAAGSLSGAVQSVVASPMELIKTRMQLDESPGSKGKSAWTVLKNVYMHEGGLRRGLFKGWCVTLAREIPGLGTYFATYEALTSKRGGDVSTFEMMMAGGMAGVFSWIACFPMDVIKTRLQSDVSGKYTGAVDCYRKTIGTEGYKALFRGLNSTVIRAFPTNAATFTAVMWVMRLAHEADNDLSGNKSNLEMLLQQWDTARVQEKIADSLQLQTPQYAFQSLAMQVGAKNTSFFQQFQEQQHLVFSQALANATSRTANTRTVNTSSKNSDSSVHQADSKTCDSTKTSDIVNPVIATKANATTTEVNANINRRSSIAEFNANMSRRSSVVGEVYKRTRTTSTSHYHHSIPQFSTEDAALSNSSSSNYLVGSDHGDLGQVVLQRVSESLNAESMKTAGGETSTASTPHTSTAEVNKKGEVSSPIRRNSHSHGSVDLIIILAEILDVPPVVLQNSLDGKPITLFNIIVTWLKEGKCDALDRCSTC